MAGPSWPRCWRWRRSAASPAPVGSRPRSATSSPAAAMIPPSWSQPSAGTGASKTPCIGCSTSPSARTTVACAIVPPPATSPSCAKSPSTSSPEIAVAKPADAVGAKWRPGTTITCSRSPLAKLMREPWDQDGGIIAAAGEEVADLGLDPTGAGDAADRLHRQHRGQLGPAIQGLELPSGGAHEDAPADQAAVALVEGVEHRPTA